jgi:hypothetical protein
MSQKIIIKDVPEDEADYYATEEALIDFGNGVECKVYNEEYESSQLSSFFHCLELLEKAGAVEVVDTRTSMC